MDRASVAMDSRVGGADIGAGRTAAVTPAGIARGGWRL